MCDLQEGFKLCTCSPESLKKRSNRFVSNKWKRIEPDPFGNGLMLQKRGIVDYDETPDAFQ